jgi:hypothetical protein
MRFVAAFTLLIASLSVAPAQLYAPERESPVVQVPPDASNSSGLTLLY